jgi:hypothetical protein
MAEPPPRVSDREGSRRTIRSALEHLTPEQAEAVDARRAGFTYEQIRAAMGGSCRRGSNAGRARARAPSELIDDPTSKNERSWTGGADRRRQSRELGDEARRRLTSRSPSSACAVGKIASAQRTSPPIFRSRRSRMLRRQAPSDLGGARDGQPHWGPLTIRAKLGEGVRRGVPGVRPFVGPEATEAGPPSCGPDALDAKSYLRGASPGPVRATRTPWSTRPRRGNARREGWHRTDLLRGRTLRHYWSRRNDRAAGGGIDRHGAVPRPRGSPSCGPRASRPGRRT